MTTAADPVVTYLAEHDAACPVCAYGLRGVPAPVCPECSAPLHLEVASAQSAPGPWLLALVSWALALGFDAVVGLLVTIGVLVARPPLSTIYPYVFVGTFLTLSAASAFGLTRVLGSRGRWSARPRRAQWQGAVITFVAVALVHAAVGAVLIING